MDDNRNDFRTIAILMVLITCSVDEENLAGKLFLKNGGFKALPMSHEARHEKVIQFARPAKG